MLMKFILNNSIGVERSYLAMKKLISGLALLLTLALTLAACGGGNGEVPANGQPNGGDKAAQTEKPAGENKGSEGQAGANAGEGTKTVTYLGQQYELPASTERIVIAGAVEAMEDAIVLDVHPVGAVTFSGVFPPMFESITKETASIGEKTEPNFEAILALKPDVILASTKFKPEVSEQLSAIAVTLPYSHISTDWESNLRLLGELGGKQEQAEEAIAGYKSDLEEAKAKFGAGLQDKKAVVVRIRGGEIYVYPENVYFNPVLYGELGLAAPSEIKAAKAQELLSVEKFAEMNPDYLFVQFSEEENKDTPNALAELQNNPIIKNTNALKNGKTFVNVVDPLAQGGTAYSKIEFLKAAVSKLSE